MDNGTNWALATMPLALANPGNGYADAGIVVDIGPTANFNGIAKSGAGDLKDNIWITDGAEAFSPGLHKLSDGADFTYGSENPDGTFYMMTGPDAGSNLSVAQIRQKYAGYEAYAWVGITGNGSSSTTGHVSSVNGKAVNGDLTLDSTTAAASGS